MPSGSSKKKTDTRVGTYPVVLILASKSRMLKSGKSAGAAFGFATIEFPVRLRFFRSAAPALAPPPTGSSSLSLASDTIMASAADATAPGPAAAAAGPAAAIWRIQNARKRKEKKERKEGKKRKDERRSEYAS